jgi:hypothetical protein
MSGCFYTLFWRLPSRVQSRIDVQYKFYQIAYKSVQCRGSRYLCSCRLTLLHYKHRRSIAVREGIRWSQCCSAELNYIQCTHRKDPGVFWYGPRVWWSSFTAHSMICSAFMTHASPAVGCLCVSSPGVGVVVWHSLYPLILQPKVRKIPYTVCTW